MTQASTNRYPTERHKAFWLKSEGVEGHRIFIDLAFIPETGKVWSVFISGSKDGNELGIYQTSAGISLSKLLRAGANPLDLEKVYPDNSIEMLVLRLLIDGELPKSARQQKKDPA